MSVLQDGYNKQPLPKSHHEQFKHVNLEHNERVRHVRARCMMFFVALLTQLSVQPSLPSCAQIVAIVG